MSKTGLVGQLRYCHDRQKVKKGFENGTVFGEAADRIEELERENESLRVDAARYDALREEYDQGILMVMHPDPNWGQLDSEATSLDDFADYLVKSFNDGDKALDEMAKLDAIDEGARK